MKYSERGWSNRQPELGKSYLLWERCPNLEIWALPVKNTDKLVGDPGDDVGFENILSKPRIEIK